MTAKYTKGPWEVQKTSGMDIFICHSHDFSGRTPGYFAEIRRFTSNHAEVEANALLIAAAPELLAALQSLLSRVSNDADAKSWFLDEQEKARAAIAKATGEQE